MMSQNDIEFPCYLGPFDNTEKSIECVAAVYPGGLGWWRSHCASGYHSKYIKIPKISCASPADEINQLYSAWPVYTPDKILGKTEKKEQPPVQETTEGDELMRFFSTKSGEWSGCRL